MAENTPPIGGEAEAGSAGTAEARFTQEQLDRHIAKRLGEERRKYEEQLKDYESIKATRAAEEEARKSDLQKAIDKAAAADDRAKKAEAGREQDRIDAAIRLKLVEMGHSPKLISLIRDNASIASVDDVAEAVQTVVDGEDWLKASQRPVSQSGSPSGSRASSGPWTREKISDARRRRASGEMSAAEWADTAKDIERAILGGAIR